MLYAILLEGAAEQAIIDILLENDRLIIAKSGLIDEKALRVRSIDKFCDKYLNRAFDYVTVYRVLDSESEKSKLNSKNKKLYQEKMTVKSIITNPEIEILYIIAEGKYQEYLKVKSFQKPSDFCKQQLKCKDIKSYAYVYGYFGKDVNKLISILKEYKSLSSTKNDTIYDLLKNKYK